MTVSRSSFLAEKRLIHKGDIGQFGRDVNDFHFRADGPIETAGSVVMTPAAVLAKLPNALAGEFSDKQAEPLGEGPLAYTARDVRSAFSNLLGGALSLKPGRVLKGAFDAFDAVTTDPLLDLGKAVSRHTRRKANTTLSTAA